MQKANSSKEENLTPKRKPGRPKSNKETLPKKPVGRPKKQTPITEELNQQVKRKPGRPPKKIPAAEEGQIKTIDQANPINLTTVPEEHLPSKSVPLEQEVLVEQYESSNVPKARTNVRDVLKERDYLEVVPVEQGALFKIRQTLEKDKAMPNKKTTPTPTTQPTPPTPSVEKTPSAEESPTVNQAPPVTDQRTNQRGLIPPSSEPKQEQDAYWNLLDAEDEASKGPLYRFALRLTEHDRNKHLFEKPQLFEDIIKGLKPKKYIFQLEEGELTKKKHYQGYIKIPSKKRISSLKIELNRDAYGIELRPARDENALIKYCKKKETRLAGPWSFPENI